MDTDIIRSRIAVPGPNGSNIAASDYTDILNRLAELERRVEPLGAIAQGRYYGPRSTLSGGAEAMRRLVYANKLVAAPVVVPQDAAFDVVGVQVATAAAAGGTMRMGIYDSGPDGLPSTLVVDLGTVDTTATGFRSRPITRTLGRGLYWIAGASNQNMDLNAYSGVDLTAIAGHMLTDGTFPTAVVQRSTDLATGFAALPATFGAMITSIGVPLYWLRAA